MIRHQAAATDLKSGDSHMTMYMLVIEEHWYLPQ